MITIVKANKEDLPEILEVIKAAFRLEAEFYNNYAIAPLHTRLEELEKIFAESIMLKFMDKGRIVASVTGTLQEGPGSGTCRISKLVVRPEYMGRGIGTRLMEAIEREFAGAGRFELLTAHRSAKNIHLYEKFGYRIYKEEQVFDTDPKMVFMEKIAGNPRG